MLRSQNNGQVLNLPRGLSVVSGTQRARVPRKPSHNFYIQQRPYELTPFFIAPVLAGETLKNLLLQARTVTTPLKNKLIGHHLEHYFFYVKLRDLGDRDDIIKMLMDTDGGAAVNKASADNIYYNVRTGVNDYLKMATDQVLKFYFRDEGDTTAHVGNVTGLPMVQLQNHRSFHESLIADAALESGTVTTGTTYPDHEKAYDAWSYMRQMQLTEMTFEDYLATFGVKLDVAEEPNKPELIRFTKNWTYPTNTVDGEGNINTQASWSIQERADKDRFIKEPGFLVGYTVWRPKVYLSNIRQSAVGLLDNALHWLPATMKEQVHSSLVKFTGGAANSPWIHQATPSGSDGRLATDSSYWLDIRDLFVYGEDFTNVTRDATRSAIMPENVRQFHGKKYPLATALQALGVGDTATADTDGIVSLNILGTQMDVT